MPKRFLSIWFPYLVPDWIERRNPGLRNEAFALFAPERNRMIVKAVSRAAFSRGVSPQMPVADCRAVFPGIDVLEFPAEKPAELLQALAEWCIRFTPCAAVGLPDGIMLDCSGCTHLLGGDEAYASQIFSRLEAFGYYVNIAVGDSIGAAWALARYGKERITISHGNQLEALKDLPPAALRLETATTEKLGKLGMKTIGQFINIPRQALVRRFGKELLIRLDQAAGFEPEQLQSVQLPREFLERLHSLEPIRTPKGIEIAVERLLNRLCESLAREGQGMRNAKLRCHRVDGNIQELSIGTTMATRSAKHLFKLFELKIGQLRPDLGFELFELHAVTVEPITNEQAAFWNEKRMGNFDAVAELLDRISGKFGQGVVNRYVPAEHHWPERSYKKAATVYTQSRQEWRTDLPRPVHLLQRPEIIEVTVPLPDYPPMLFRYRGKIHQVKRADGPERIEQEWWLQKDIFRDYYCVEDENGQRYWLFRSGHHGSGQSRWYIHGFFA